MNDHEQPQRKPEPDGDARRSGLKDRRRKLAIRAAPAGEGRQPLIDRAEMQPIPADMRFPPVDPRVVMVQGGRVKQLRGKRRVWLPNVVTGFFSLASLITLMYFIRVWNDPFSSINPLPPPTPLPIIITTTPVVTDTATPLPTATFTPLPAVAVRGPTPLPFALSDAGITYVPNENGQGCAWSAIAGTVTGADGVPPVDFTVRVQGDGVDETVFSGSVPAFGRGGFEVFLSDIPQQAPYTVQLFDSGRQPVSDEIVVVTSQECSQNVAIVNFVG